MTKTELKEFLDAKVIQYNNPIFIESDPIQIPHQFSLKEDIEISAFLTATIAWGNRKMIIKNAHRMMNLLGNSPYDFIMQHNDNQLDNLNSFVHRTFNPIDFSFFIKSLKNIYQNHNGLEAIFVKNAENDSLQNAIHHFKKVFFEIEHPHRTQKHISDPLKNSAAKRINMFLRWMVRNDQTGVDLVFGRHYLHRSFLVRLTYILEMLVGNWVYFTENKMMPKHYLNSTPILEKWMLMIL